MNYQLSLSTLSFCPILGILACTPEIYLILFLAQSHQLYFVAALRHQKPVLCYSVPLLAWNPLFNLNINSAFLHNSYSSLQIHDRHCLLCELSSKPRGRVSVPSLCTECMSVVYNLPYFNFIIFIFIHMCIHCLGYFSPTPCFQEDPAPPSCSPILLKRKHKQ
jgi:hypothetical protein